MQRPILEKALIAVGDNDEHARDLSERIKKFSESNDPKKASQFSLSKQDKTLLRLALKQISQQCKQHIQAFGGKMSYKRSRKDKVLDIILLISIIIGGTDLIVLSVCAVGFILSLFVTAAIPPLAFWLIAGGVLFVAGAATAGIGLYKHKTDLLTEEKNHFVTGIKCISDALTLLPEQTSNLLSLNKSMRKFEKSQNRREIVETDTVFKLGNLLTTMQLGIIYQNLENIDQVLIPDQPVTPVLQHVIVHKPPMAEGSMPGQFSGAIFAVLYRDDSEVPLLEQTPSPHAGSSA